MNTSVDATVLVYFSGHGGRIEQLGKPPKYCLIPSDYDSQRLAETTLSGLAFTNKIEALKARKLVVFLDCCHAGAIPVLKELGKTFVKSPLLPDLLQILDTGSGRVVITSSHEHEKSYVGTDYSIFTACLLEALEGKAAVQKDGFARILDILIYLFSHVPQRAPGPQHPFVKKMLDLGDNFPLCYYAGGKYVAGEIAESESLLTSRGLTSGKRHRLTQQSDALHQEWDIRSEKVKRMRSALVIESAVTIRFQLEQQLLEEEAQLAHLGSQIDEIEQALQ